jgi:hypothetical protein
MSGLAVFVCTVVTAAAFVATVAAVAAVAALFCDRRRLSGRPVFVFDITVFSALQAFTSRHIAVSQSRNGNEGVIGVAVCDVQSGVRKGSQLRLARFVLHTQGARAL